MGQALDVDFRVMRPHVRQIAFHPNRHAARLGGVEIQQVNLAELLVHDRARASRFALAVIVETLCTTFDQANSIRLVRMRGKGLRHEAGVQEFEIVQRGVAPELCPFTTRLGWRS